MRRMRRKKETGEGRRRRKTGGESRASPLDVMDQEGPHEAG